MLLVSKKWALGIALFGLLLSLRPLIFSNSGEAASSATASTANTLMLRDMSWSKTRYGVLFAHFSVSNESQIAVKDFTILCATYGESGTALGQVSKTIYEIIPAQSIKDYEGIEIGLVDRQTANVQCQAISRTKK